MSTQAPKRGGDHEAPLPDGAPEVVRGEPLNDKYVAYLAEHADEHPEWGVANKTLKALAAEVRERRAVQERVREFARGLADGGSAWDGNDRDTGRRILALLGDDEGVAR